ERSVNLGLDLRGGMNVTLEISVEDIIKKMSNDNADPIFNKALQQAQETHMVSTRPFVDLFGDAFQKLNPSGKLATYFQTSELKDAFRMVLPHLKKHYAYVLTNSVLPSQTYSYCQVRAVYW